jgi:tetratricopeptide (TPR) repeat protein
MRNIRIISTLVVLMVAMALMPGCSSYAQKKRDAHMKWSKVSAKAKVDVAKDFFRNGRYEDALATARQCVLSDPELAAGHLVIGKVYYVNGRFAQAQSALIQAVGYDENLDEAWYWLGEIALHNKTPLQALEHYNRAMSIRPTSTDYIIAVVETYASQGRYEDSLRLLEGKMELMPANADLKVADADISQRLGRTSQAIRMYSQALLIDSDNVDIAESLGYCYIEQENYKDAARMFERVAQDATGENKTAALKLLAMCSMNSGQYGKAVGYYNTLSLEKRDDEQLWLQMGQAALGAGAPNRAGVCAARALSLRPGWPDAIALEGCAQYLKNDYDTAIQTFSRLTTNEKMGGFAWLMSGRCYQQLGRQALADKAYENASQLNPQSKLISLLSNNQ